MIQYILENEHTFIPDSEVQLLHAQGELDMALDLYDAMVKVQETHEGQEITPDHALREARYIQGVCLGHNFIDGHDLLDKDGEVYVFATESWKSKLTTVVKLIIKALKKIIERLRMYWHDNLSKIARLESEAREKIGFYITEVRSKVDKRPMIPLNSAMSYAFNVKRNTMYTPEEIATLSEQVEMALNPGECIDAVDFAVRQLEDAIVTGETSHATLIEIQEKFWSRVAKTYKMRTFSRGRTEHAEAGLVQIPHRLTLIRDKGQATPPSVNTGSLRIKLPNEAEGLSPTEAYAAMGQVVNLAATVKDQSNIVKVQANMEKLRDNIEEKAESSTGAGSEEYLRMIPKWINLATSFTRRSLDYRINVTEGLMDYIKTSEEHWVNKT